MPHNVLAAGIVWFAAIVGLSAQDSAFEKNIRQSVERSLPLLETASAETARRRICVTCHGQALPAVVFETATKRGFHVDARNQKRQLDHTYAHLKRSKARYTDGRGTGGQVDTAGWALWGLETRDREADDVTDAVIKYLLGKQTRKGLWRCSSNRPPSEKSHFATTYLALRAFDSFGQDTQAEKIESARETAKSWFEKTDPKDTEDRIFQLLSLPYVGLDDRANNLTDQLKRQQRADGGWGQLPGMESDAYATATVLYALEEGGMQAANPRYQRGLKFLIKNQQADGSWHVTSRSKPFQTYFETGYPHGKDQFISMTAACWATLVMLRALPERTAPPIDGAPNSEPTKRTTTPSEASTQGDVEQHRTNDSPSDGGADAATRHRDKAVHPPLLLGKAARQRLPTRPTLVQARAFR